MLMQSRTSKLSVATRPDQSTRKERKAFTNQVPPDPEACPDPQDLLVSPGTREPVESPERAAPRAHPELVGSPAPLAPPDLMEMKVCQESSDPRDPPEPQARTGDQVFPECPDLKDTEDSTAAPAPRVPEADKERRVELAPPGPLEAPEVKDHVGPPVRGAATAPRECRASEVRMGPQAAWAQADPQDPQEMPDSQDHKDRREMQERTASLATPAPRAPLVQTVSPAPRAPTETLEREEATAPLDLKEDVALSDPLASQVSPDLKDPQETPESLASPDSREIMVVTVTPEPPARLGLEVTPGPPERGE